MRAAIALFPIHRDYEADAVTLLDQCFRETGVQFNPLLRRAMTTGHLAYSGPVPVGVILLHAMFDPKERGDFAEISTLYVTRWCRRVKVASALLHAAEREGLSYGWQGLDVGAAETGALRPLLAQRGFAAQGMRMTKALHAKPALR
jgi:hypothetical protein